MTKQVFKFEDFEIEKLSEKEQKTVLGGYGDNDPTKGNGNGNTQPTIK